MKFSKMWGTTSAHRFDAEYFQKQYLLDEEVVQDRQNEFRSFADMGVKVDGSAFYPAIEEYYGTGSLPFIRVSDVNTVIDCESCVRIPAELTNRFPTLSKVQNGDIVFTKGGSVARIGLVTEDAAVSRDLIFLDTSRLSSEDRALLYLYAQTEFFKRLLIRSSSQTAQPHLTITLVRDLPLLSISRELRAKCARIVDEAYRERKISISRMVSAELALERAIGLQH